MKFCNLHKNILIWKISSRWWWGLFRNSLILLFVLIFWAADIYAQTDIIQPDPPVFESVSINPSSGDVTIQWEKSPSADVAGYVVQEDRGSGSFPIDTIFEPTTPSFTFPFPKVLDGTVGFNIYAIDSAYNNSNYTSPSHFTMFTKLEYDSCNSSILVKWTPYIGWGTKLIKYKIFSIENNNVLTLIGETNSNTTEFLVTGIIENQNYCYYVYAERNDGITVTSTDSCQNTAAPIPPVYILGNSTRYQGSNSLNLQFSVDPAAIRDAYRLYRSSSPNGNYQLLAEINKDTNGEVAYTDALPSLNQYYYKLVYINGCKNEGNSSVPINNILLNGSSASMANKLKWNLFEEWPNGIDMIQVYRSQGSNAVELITTLSSNATEYIDQISSQDEVQGDICYYVRFISKPDQLGIVRVSESNIFCVNMLGDVFVPNAFTPNGDGQNDVFIPSFSILPSKFLFSLYDRYGFKVFETSDYSKGWDGKLPNGKKALEGSYIYYLRIENASGGEIEKRGNFSVIYP